ncbi:MAG: twin-arginine translocation signal domain-containing protein, partial [Nitrospiraceae bacterium]
MAPDTASARGWTRRDFLKALAGGVVLASSVSLGYRLSRPRLHAETLIAKVDRYESDIASIIGQGLFELGVTPQEIKGKRILLKPNLVETDSGAIHINTHPLVIRGAVEA